MFWQNYSCKIPKINKKNIVKNCFGDLFFEYGVHLFIYHIAKSLKWICRERKGCKFVKLYFPIYDNLELKITFLRILFHPSFSVTSKKNVTPIPRHPQKSVRTLILSFSVALMSVQLLRWQSFFFLLIQMGVFLPCLE